MSTPLERYKYTLHYIHENLKETIDIPVIEKISCYSYRHINRIFLSVHQETIGKYIKRLRLEKAAEYIKYSEQQLYDIALEVGFSDLASFSKAFKNKFGCSPTAFRHSTQEPSEIKKHLNLNQARTKLNYQIESLPPFKMLFLEHRGSYRDLAAIEQSWETFLEYCEHHQLLSEGTVYLSESLDDNAISDDLNCRTNLAIILDDKFDFEPSGLFLIKEHELQKYVKFKHIGRPEKLEETYDLIYATWITDIQLEFEDKPTLEFYVNYEHAISPDQYLTEIYIPIE